MSGYPGADDHRWKNDPWHADRAIPIVHAIDLLLDRLEALYIEDEDHPPVEQLLPLSTGLIPLDLVLNGGIHRGTVAVVEADYRAQAFALVNTAARTSPHRTLLDAGHFFHTMAELISGGSGVPKIHIENGWLTKAEWERIAKATADLRERELHLCSTGSLAALAQVCRRHEPELMLVHDLTRFGRPIDHLPKLMTLARKADMAILAWTEPMGELPPFLTETVTRLSMIGYQMGGRASLVRPDSDDMLAVAQIEVEALCSTVR